MDRTRTVSFPALLAVLALSLAACEDSLELSELPAGVIEMRIDSLRTLWTDLRPSYVGAPYTVLPIWEAAPYAPGELDPGFVADGMNTLYFLRYVVGLEALLQVGDYREDTQHGAALLAHWDELDPSPEKPADMDDFFYSSALNGLAGSNMAGAELAGLGDAVERWLDAASPTDHLRDRRWLLSPRMARTAFGFVEGFALLYVQDESGTPTEANEVVAWPAQPATPLDFFDASSYWTVSLDRDVYQVPSAAGVTVTVTRRSDERSWVLDASTGGSAADGSWFAVDDGAPLDPAIIFRPGSDAVPTNGSTFDIEIEGLRYTGGTPAPLAYEVTFFSLEG